MIDTSQFVKNVSMLLSKANTTPIKRIIIYAIVIYPLFFGFYYKDEVLSLFTSSKDDQVKVRKLDVVSRRCFDLRRMYNAEAVMFYVYQPNSSEKSHKERIAVSASPLYNLLEQNDKIRLITRTHVIEDLRKSGFAKITPTSGHILSSVLFTYGLDVAYVVPIKDISTTSIIGEVIYVFASDDNIDVDSLITAAQMFSYDFE